MLDTKLKKSPKKIKNLIIALIVLVPALVLVCLYPTMEKAMLEKRAEHLEVWNSGKEAYEKEQAAKEEALREQEKTDTEEKTGEITSEEELPAEVIDPEHLSEKEATSATEAVASSYTSEDGYGLQESFINYAVETSYYQYAMMLQDTTEDEIDLDVLEVYGWINDYYTFTDAAPYYLAYGAFESGDEDASEEQALNGQWGGDFVLSDEDVERILANETFSDDHKFEWYDQGCLGYLYMRYDRHGRLADIRIDAASSLQAPSGIYRIAKKSIDQYENNVRFADYETDGNPEYSKDPMEVCPKDFQCIYLIMEDNEMFVYSGYETENYAETYYTMEPYYSPDGLYFETGAYWIVLAFAVFVFAAAMLLPFFKRLDTGREKLFCIPMEPALGLAGAGFLLAVGMCYLMSVTTMDHLNEQIIEYGYQVQLLGYTFTPKECYRMLIAVNFLGWGLAFFIEYICAAQLRQLFAAPRDYLRNRLLVVRLFRWLFGKCRQFFGYLTRIDIDEGMHKSILKIVLADAVLVMLLCCMWFVGAAGAVIYAVLLYLLLRKYGEKLQKQYQSILNATGQMADGDLQITLEEDLGILKPLGEELSRVQEGFAKAVAEEAKSQNMKSELITNVSHDLKTPLTAIITYVDLLKNPELTQEERQSYIETLDLKSQRLKILIEDLFEVSKANSGNVKLNFMEVDVVKLLKEIRVELADKLEASTLDFRWNLPDEKVLLTLDGQRTYRIFENLLNNAMKYAMPHTRVYVDVSQEETEVLVTFKNMSAQELDFDAQRLTERFVRGDSSRNSEGSGLGLAIAKSFTELQHGKFEISVDGDLFKVSIRFLKK